MDVTKDENSIFLQGSWSIDAESKCHKLTGTWTRGSEQATGELFTLVCRPSEYVPSNDWKGGIFGGFFMYDGEAVKEEGVQIGFEYDCEIDTYILLGHGENKYGAFQLTGTAKPNIFEANGQYTVNIKKVYDEGNDDNKKSKGEKKKKYKRRSKRKKTPTAKAVPSKSSVTTMRAASRNMPSVKHEDEPEIIEILDEDVVVKCEEQNENTLMLVEGWLQDNIPFLDPARNGIDVRAYAEKLIHDGYDTIQALEYHLKYHLKEKDLIEMNFKRAHRQALLGIRNTLHSERLHK